VVAGGGGDVVDLGQASVAHRSTKNRPAATTASPSTTTAPGACVFIQLRLRHPMVDLRTASRRTVASFYLASITIGCACSVLEARSGTGSIPDPFKISHMVEAVTLISRTRSSPWILLYPQPRFSRARRKTRALMQRRVSRPTRVFRLGCGGVRAFGQGAVPAQDRVGADQEPQAAQHVFW
jgi:hypothetical protein